LTANRLHFMVAGEILPRKSYLAANWKDATLLPCDQGKDLLAWPRISA
jgi:hypothetical protein